jgi:hypothetical protein
VLFGGVEDPWSVTERDARHANPALRRHHRERNREQNTDDNGVPNESGVRHESLARQMLLAREATRETR